MKTSVQTVAVPQEEAEKTADVASFKASSDHIAEMWQDMSWMEDALAGER